MPDGPDGGLPRGSVLDVLRANGVTVAALAGASDGVVILSAPDVDPEVQRLPDTVHRRMVQRLANRFGIDPHKFWHAAPN
jgi:hypothetical protein